MQFEKIRRINKSKIIVRGVIGLGVIGAITILPSFAKYKLTESINIANGVVNYKVPDFKVMAMFQQNESGDYEETTTMPESGYVINEEKTYCTTDNVNQVKGKIKTENGKVILQNLTKGDKCYLYFDKNLPKNVGELIASLEIKEETDTEPNFNEMATTDEGVYKRTDSMYGGFSYYWRGAVTNNYIKFANFCWRIVRINGDNTIRLIYDGTTCHTNGAQGDVLENVTYTANSNSPSYVGWTYEVGSQRTLSGTASNAKTQTESWYSSNIGNNSTFANKVAKGKFCNDRNIQDTSVWSTAGEKISYSSIKRLFPRSTEIAKPTLNCNTGDVYALNVGAITADEIVMAGIFSSGTGNNQNYLSNRRSYWTMTPYYWNGTIAYMVIADSSGFIMWETVNANNISIRPVINLKADVTFSSGDGTLNTPYIVQ